MNETNKCNERAIRNQELYPRKILLTVEQLEAEAKARKNDNFGMSDGEFERLKDTVSMRIKLEKEAAKEKRRAARSTK